MEFIFQRVSKLVDIGFEVKRQVIKPVTIQNIIEKFNLFEKTN